MHAQLLYLDSSVDLTAPHTLQGKASQFSSLRINAPFICLARSFPKSPSLLALISSEDIVVGVGGMIDVVWLLKRSATKTKSTDTNTPRRKNNTATERRRKKNTAFHGGKTEIYRVPRRPRPRREEARRVLSPNLKSLGRNETVGGLLRVSSCRRSCGVRLSVFPSLGPSSLRSLGTDNENCRVQKGRTSCIRDLEMTQRVLRIKSASKSDKRALSERLNSNRSATSPPPTRPPTPLSRTRALVYWRKAATRRLRRSLIHPTEQGSRQPPVYRKSSASTETERRLRSPPSTPSSYTT